MSSLNTFLFEEVLVGPMVNKDSLIYPVKGPGNTKGHKNAEGGYKQIVYRKGRYGQTVGNILGDNLIGTPACPYHMPRNIKRFDEPHLHVAKKNIGDVIQASDINNLIDKIKLFQYAWEAEANNVYSYGGVNGYINAKVDISKLSYIESSGSNQPAYTLHDSKISGATDNYLPKIANFFCCDGVSQQNVVNKLNAAAANKTKTFVSFNNILPYGFPEYLDSMNSTDTHTMIHGGHANIIGIKAIQYMDGTSVSPNFKLQYVDGAVTGHVKGKDSNDMVFNYNTPYVISWLEDNQPSTLPKYFGFILYYLGNDIVDNLPDSELVTETITSSATTGINSFGTMASALSGTELDIDRTKTIIAAGTTAAINYDFAATINNIQLHDPEISYGNTPGDTFWALWLPRSFTEGYGQYLTRVNAVKAQLLALPNRVVKIPAQKVVGNKCYRQATNGTWIEQDAIYIFEAMEITTKQTDAYEDSEGGFVLTYARGFNIHAGKWDPTSRTVTYNHAAPFGTFKTKPLPAVIANSSLASLWSNKPFYDYDDTMFNDLIAWMIPKTFTSSDNPSSAFGFPWFKDNFVMYSTTVHSEDGDTDYFTYFKENGVGATDFENTFIPSRSTTGQANYFYTVGTACPDGSAPVNGVCTYTSTRLVTYANIIDTTTSPNLLKINESDITYKKGIYFVGEGTYPEIKTADFKNIKNVLNKYITNILTLSQTQINNGTSDSATFQELDTFLSTQMASADPYDADDPDTSFEGYQIASKGIIKLNFYNILVDAYKLIINGCICNSDCACNLVCACNTNCGCNYGK